MSTIKTANIQNPSAGSAAITIDTSSRVGIGTASAGGKLHVSSGSSSALVSADADELIVENSGNSGITIATPNSGTGSIRFADPQNNDSGSISYNHNDETLRFATFSTERMRIDSSGRVGIGTTSPSYKLDVQDVINVRVDGSNNAAIYFNGSATRVSYNDSTGHLRFFTNSAERAGVYYNGGFYITYNGGGGTAQVIDRTAADGTLIQFQQAGTTEGEISVSGTTVTYGGGHLARWSQLPNDEDPSVLLKGTVMSNLDEMCEWGEEDNEQLNKTKVSDVEGDPNVAGVFVATSPSEDGPLDFFVGMTGDMIIRIAADVTVERGDLLMSAGDGTAKPQDDDIIRSKTIAKVTSTHVTCTYDDGSYCVPCVLMAC